MDDLAKSFPAAEPGWASIPVSVPSWANVTLINSAGDFAASGEHAAARRRLRSCHREFAQIQPSWHWKSMPESYLADANRR